MIIFSEVEALRKYISTQKIAGKIIGFAPTMGALHKGHLSLISLSREHCQVIVVSIFVNPTQFNSAQDFAHYPITIEQDRLLLEKAGVDVLFLPSVTEIYPNGVALNKPYDLGKLDKILDGKYRPGHFQGVCQVVQRLLEIVRPSELFLGQKDYQQCLVIKKLIDIMGVDIKLTIAPTFREPSGLAMSSRNLRLDAEQLYQASNIYKEMVFIKNNIEELSFEALKQKASKALLDKGFSKIDYIEIASLETLESIRIYDSTKPIIVLVAAFLGEIRLIDNLLL